MAAPASRLAIDLSSNSIRVVQGTMGSHMQCGSSAAPDGAVLGGKVTDPGGVARALKALLARTEITQTRAMVAAGDGIGTFRVVRLPASAGTKDIDASIARELGFDPQRMATRWIDLPSPPDSRLIYAVAWERTSMKNLIDAVRQAGLEPNVVELKSACVARAVPVEACVLIDLCATPAELVLVDRHVAQVWHSFPIPEPLGSDDPSHLARAVRSILRFYRRGPDGSFGEMAPIFVSSEQALPADVLAELSRLVSQPVHALPAPPRVPSGMRHSTYLACLGLLMRRGQA